MRDEFDLMVTEKMLHNMQQSSRFSIPKEQRASKEILHHSHQKGSESTQRRKAVPYS